MSTPDTANLVQLLTDAAWHLKEHSSDYDHVSPKSLQEALTKAAKAIAAPRTPAAPTVDDFGGNQAEYDAWKASGKTELPPIRGCKVVNTPGVGFIVAAPSTPPEALSPEQQFDALMFGANVAETLLSIGRAIGFGRVQQIAGEQWEAEHDCAPRGQMGVTVGKCIPPKLWNKRGQDAYRRGWTECEAALSAPSTPAASIAQPIAQIANPIAHAALAATQAQASQDAIDALRRALEIIAVGDSTDPVTDAGDELVALGYWSAEAVKTYRAQVQPDAKEPK